MFYVLIFPNSGVFFNNMIGLNYVLSSSTSILMRHTHIVSHYSGNLVDLIVWVPLISAAILMMCWPFDRGE